MAGLGIVLRKLTVCFLVAIVIFAAAICIGASLQQNIAANNPGMKYLVVNFEVNSKEIYYGTRKISMSASTSLYQGRVMVPAKPLMETFGGNITWDKTEKSVEMSLGKEKLKMWMGKNIAIKDGVQTYTDVAPVVIANTFLIPARFFAQQFVLRSSWDSRKQVIMLAREEMFSEENISNSVSTIVKEQLEAEDSSDKTDSSTASTTTKRNVNYDIYDINNCNFPEIIVCGKTKDGTNKLLIFTPGRHEYEKLTECDLKDFSCAGINVVKGSEGSPVIQLTEQSGKKDAYILYRGNLYNSSDAKKAQLAH